MMESAAKLDFLYKLPQPQPNHIGIIMDGSRRWSKKHQLPVSYGHRAGAKNVRRIVECCSEAGIANLTLFAFSTENWQRPRDEINFLFGLMKNMLKNDVAALHEQNIKVSVIGDRTLLPKNIQQVINHAETLTGDNSQLHLRLAVNYGGRWDITMAMRRIASSIQSGELVAEDVDEELIGRYTAMQADVPVDLCIRTGGEQRLSNFLLWDLAYAELYFTTDYWPEFDSETLLRALDSYANRERRYGGQKDC